jgi:hypothetical protein
MLRARPTAVLILGCLCVSPACAQQLSCLERTIPVSIASTDNAPLLPLSSGNFKGTYQKRPVRIKSISVSDKPSRVILLLDARGSMQVPKSQRTFAIGIGEDLVAGLPPTTEIGLAFFSANSVRVAIPTNDREKLKAKLEAFRTDPKASPPQPRKTALWDAIIDSFYMFDQPHVGDAIYVITDGFDNSSHSTSKDAAETLGAAGVRLFAFVFRTSGMGPRQTGQLDRSNLFQIIGDTGGIFIDFRPHYSGLVPYFPDPDLFDKSGKPTTLGILLAPQARQILIFYRLEIELPETGDKPRELKLDLVGFGKSQREGIVMTYPHILLPCR